MFLFGEMGGGVFFVIAHGLEGCQGKAFDLDAGLCFEGDSVVREVVVHDRRIARRADAADVGGGR